MAKTTQLQVVLEHLQKWGSITSLEAIELYGITRLAAIIFLLRKQGYQILSVDCKGVNRLGQPTRYTEYRYEGALVEIA